MKKVFGAIKYYILEKPILYIAYVAIGFLFIGYLLCSSYIPVYNTYIGHIQLDGNKYLVTLDNNIDNVQGKIYIYSLDFSNRLIIEDYEATENQIIFSEEDVFEDNESIKCRVETKQEKLIERIIVNGGN